MFEHFTYQGRDIYLIKSKRSNGPEIRAISVRKNGQIDIVIRANLKQEQIISFLNKNWNSIKDSRGPINFANQDTTAHHNINNNVTKNIIYPSGDCTYYLIDTKRSFSIEVTIYSHALIKDPIFYEVKEINNKKQTTILIPKEWSKPAINNWIYRHQEYIDSQFFHQYGATFVESFMPQELYSILSEWEIFYQIENRLSFDYIIDKGKKHFKVLTPFNCPITSIKEELHRLENKIKREITDDKVFNHGIIGSIRNNTAAGCNFAVAPSMKSRSTSYRNVSNDFWRGSGWVRDITETPSERAANVKDGKRLLRTAPISSHYAKASDLRGLGVFDASGRLTFIDKKNDAWIEDKNN